MEIKIKYSKRSKKVDALIEFLKTLDFISVDNEELKSPYKKEFVKEVKEAENGKKRIPVDPHNLWESIK